MAPSKLRFVTYYRVSTEKQGKSGLGLEAQTAMTEQYLASVGGLALATFTEIESGKRNDRPQLEAALLRCRQTRATLLVAKLDRLSRNVAFLMAMRDSGVKFQALDIPDANTLTLTVMAGLAQHEREIISARTKAALAARKARGLKLGTPRDLSSWAASGAAKGRAILSDMAKERAMEIMPVIVQAKASGCATLRAIARYLNDSGVVTPRGRQWTAMAVYNAQLRAETGG